jgi:tol-pal system protein YbgF
MSRRDRFDKTPEDRLVTAAYEFFDWVVLHKAACIVGLVAAAAVILAGLAYWNHLNDYNESAAAAFEAARKPEDYKAVTDTYPGSSVEPLALFYQGRKLVDEKKYKEAGEAFSTLARSYPGHYLAPGAREFAGMVSAQQKNYEEAVKNYRAVVDDYPKSFAAPRALLGLGACYESMNRPADAKAAYEKIIASYGTSDLKKDAQARIAKLANPAPAAPAPLKMTAAPIPAGSPALPDLGKSVSAPGKDSKEQPAKGPFSWAPKP